MRTMHGHGVDSAARKETRVRVSSLTRDQLVMAAHRLSQPCFRGRGIQQCFNKGYTVAPAQLRQLIFANGAGCCFYCAMNDEIRKATTLKAGGFLAECLGFRADSCFQAFYFLRLFLRCGWRDSAASPRCSVAFRRAHPDLECTAHVRTLQHGSEAWISAKN